ncbi:MAG: lactate 2-monooxygenase [Chloroflexi bacterium]|nr:lactate 2-monooxygenase [Chloroflexota bacterium]
MSDREFSRERQIEIYVKGLSGKRSKVPVDMKALEEAAQAVMSEEAYAYIAGGAGMESTMQANRAAFERWRIVPRMLNDVSTYDTSVTLFGDTLPGPFLLAPIGVLDMAHKDADVAVARAAAEEGIPMIFSNQASAPMEDCAAVMGDSPRWFQLYWSKMDDVVVSLVQRAENCGCSAIVVTLDTTMLGWRIRDLDLAYLPFLRGRGIAQYTSDPVFMENLIKEANNTGRSVTINTLKALWEMVTTHPGNALNNLRSGEAIAAVQTFIATYSRSSLTWDDLAFLRDHTSLPILLKGILHPDDARKALDYGVDGVIVSNHGGRQVDGSISTIDALPDIVDTVGVAIPVLMDSGIRSGADMFKALALGAKAVCLGRPYVYGLAAGGYMGVREVIRNFKADFELTMRLSGCRSVDEITRDALKYV